MSSTALSGWVGEGNGLKFKKTLPGSLVSIIWPPSATMQTNPHLSLALLITADGYEVGYMHNAEMLTYGYRHASP